MIVVTTPTGNIGRHVVQHLLAAGEPLRLVAREPSKLPANARDRAELIEGSHGDAAVVERAFEGADAVFWLAPPDPTLTMEQAYLDFTRPAAEAIRRHKVGHVVSITALGRGTRWEDRAGLVTASIRMDDMLMQTGAAFRGLAMPGFMENTLQQADPIREQGLMFGPLDPDKKLPSTATQDMGAVAARLLRDRSWNGQADIPLLGPEELSMNDMASIVADVLGHAVRYQQVPFDDFKGRLLQRGMSESFAEGYVDMMKAKNEGMDNEASKTGAVHAPTTYRRWCETVLKPAIAA